MESSTRNHIQDPEPSGKPLALLIGLCSHGLAMTRALHKHGVEVHALEANPRLPGARTNTATVHFVKDIKTDSLVDDLIQFRKQFPSDRKIVLYATNDNSVRIIATHMEQLKSLYEISWRDSAEPILALLQKSNIEQRCEEVGLNYPQSFIINDESDIEEAASVIGFTAIVKPVQPQSGFKTLKCHNKEELRDIVREYKADLPILMQNFISGTDRDLYFGALYLDHGNVLRAFIGNKLESFPPAMGQTTVAVTSDDTEVLNITKQFFEGLALSGPVSLELKRDEQGRYWIIEPTVGRTDFWVDLCVAAGCNLLFTEHLNSLGLPLEKELPVQPTIWFDSERDVFAFWRHMRKCLPWQVNRLKPTFSYFDVKDTIPFFIGMRILSRRLRRSFFARLGKS